MTEEAPAVKTGWPVTTPKSSLRLSAAVGAPLRCGGFAGQATPACFEHAEPPCVRVLQSEALPPRIPDGAVRQKCMAALNVTLNVALACPASF